MIFFLLVGFPAKETEYIRLADQFREEFEDGLRQSVRLADGIVSPAVLASGEVVTEFTQKAECQTSNLTGVPFDMKITEAEKRLHAGKCAVVNREIGRRTLHTADGTLSYGDILLDTGTLHLICTAFSGRGRYSNSPGGRQYRRHLWSDQIFR